MMYKTVLNNKSVGEIAIEDIRTTTVFGKYKIDFCCNGSDSLAEACKRANADIETVSSELHETMSKKSDDLNDNFNEWELDKLADYIVKVHHSYVAENIPVILEFTKKIANVHGENHPELKTIASHFQAVADELSGHMMKEERILFPHIHRLVDTQRSNSELTTSPFGTIRNPIRMMEMEHENAGNLLKEIRSFSNDYSVPADGCQTYKAAFFKLEEFEKDLHQHIHLENNILFPKSIELEEKLVH